MYSNTPIKKILILAANPKGTSPLRLDEELRDIAEGLQRSQKRDQFSLEQKLAVRSRDIQRAMLDINPHIVHFSGHGAGEEGLVFEDDTGQSKLVSGTALAGLFELFADQVECVVLNGCYSLEQATAIAQHIKCVIGMSKAIGDEAAIEFASISNIYFTHFICLLLNILYHINQALDSICTSCFKLAKY